MSSPVNILKPLDCFEGQHPSDETQKLAAEAPSQQLISSVTLN